MGVGGPPEPAVRWRRENGRTLLERTLRARLARTTLVFKGDGGPVRETKTPSAEGGVSGVSGCRRR